MSDFRHGVWGYWCIENGAYDGYDSDTLATINCASQQRRASVYWCYQSQFRDRSCWQQWNAYADEPGHIMLNGCISKVLEIYD
jgi:hypothetical protein